MKSSFLPIPISLGLRKPPDLLDDVIKRILGHHYEYRHIGLIENGNASMMVHGSRPVRFSSRIDGLSTFVYNLWVTHWTQSWLPSSNIDWHHKPFKLQLNWPSVRNKKTLSYLCLCIQEGRKPLVQLNLENYFMNNKVAFLRRQLWMYVTGQLLLAFFYPLAVKSCESMFRLLRSGSWRLNTCIQLSTLLHGWLEIRQLIFF